MLSQDVRLFVRLSHTGILWTPQNISLFFYLQVVPPFQFLFTKHYGNVLTGTPLTGASNARGYEEIAIFDQYARFISEMMQVRTIVTMECEYESVLKLSNGAIFDHLKRHDLSFKVTILVNVK